MDFTTALRAAAFAFLGLWAAMAHAADASVSSPGKAAAHAALSEGADVPATAPQLPTDASEPARKALSTTAFGRKGDAASQAQAEAQTRAATDAVDAHVDAALRTAQGSVAAAARAANTEARMAAGAARATAVRTSTSTHPTGGRP